MLRKNKMTYDIVQYTPHEREITKSFELDYISRETGSHATLNQQSTPVP